MYAGPIPSFVSRWSTETHACSVGEPIGDLARAVGRAVVDDENLVA